MATFSASIISSQMKATVRFYYKSNRMTNAKKTGNSIVLGVGEAGNRHTDRSWNRIERPEIDSGIYGRLIYDEGAEGIQWDKDSLLNKWCRKNWISTRERTRLDHCLTPYGRTSSKWIPALGHLSDPSGSPFLYFQNLDNAKVSRFAWFRE